MVYDIYLFCELYLLSFSSLFHLKINYFFLKKKRNPDKIFPAEATKGFTGSCLYPVYSLGDWERGPCAALWVPALAWAGLRLFCPAQAEPSVDSLRPAPQSCSRQVTVLFKSLLPSPAS